MNNVNKLYHFLTIAAVTAALAACSADDVQEATQPASAPQALTFQVEDQGMKPLQGTRAIDNKDYTKQMLAGDAIGVFRVEQVGGNWTVTAVNVKYVLNENGQWDYQATGDAILTGPESDTGFQSDPTDHNAPIIYYFAYYPYQGNDDTFAIANGDYSWADAVTAATAASGGSDAAVAQARAEGFFKGLIAKWRPKHDQSTQAKYSNQDLMVAAATVNNDNTVVFQMAHQMAMVEIRFAQVIGYKYNVSGGIGTTFRFKDDPDYYVGLDYSEIDIKKNDNINYSRQNRYRLIVRPDEVTTIQGEKYNPDTDAKTQNWYVQTNHQLTKGQYQVFGTSSLTSTIYSNNFNVGDILYSDGYFSSTAVSGHGDPLGVVVYKNTANNYVSNRTCEKDENPKCGGNAFKIAGRGLVMSHKLTGSYQWSTSNGDQSPSTELSSISNYQSSYNVGNGYFPNVSNGNSLVYDFYGLGKTNQKVNNSSYPVFYNGIRGWRSSYPVPVGCSDWFMLSAGQCREMLLQRGTTVNGFSWVNNYGAINAIHGYIHKITGYADFSQSTNYQLSSEYDSSTTIALLWNSSNGILLNTMGKTGNYPTRAFLAF